MLQYIYCDNSILSRCLNAPSKIVREWDGQLEISSRLQAIENSGQYLLLRTDILQKTVVSAPDSRFVYVVNILFITSDKAFKKVFGILVRMLL